MSFATVLLLANLAAAPATKVLLLPQPADADGAQRAVADALAARLGTQRGLAVVPSDRLLAPPASPSDERLRAEIDDTLARVQDAFRASQFGEASRLLQALENARLAELGCPDRITLAGRIAFWMGVVHASKKETARATERFSTVLSIDPDYPIDAGYFSPQVVAVFEKVRKGLSAAPTGGLSLSGEPAAAQVFLDGRAAGTTPVTLRASEGDHFVCVRRVGWKDWAARLRVTAGKVDTQGIYLQRAAAEDVDRQLAAVLGGKPARLDDVAHVDALGAALGVDVVLELPAAGTLRWREVKGMPEPREASAASVDAPPEKVAEELALALGEALGVRPVADAVEPDRPAPISRFDVEAAVSGALLLSSGRGGLLGVRLGFWWNPRPTVGLGVRAGVAKSFLDVGLFVPSMPQRSLGATSVGVLELPVSLEARWNALRTGAWRLSVQGGLGLRVAVFSAPVAVLIPGPPGTQPQAIVSFPTSTPAQPFTAAMLGPHLGATAAYALTPRVALVVGADYGLEFVLASVPATRVQPPQQPITLTTDPVRHLLSLDVGVQWRFE